MENNTNSRSSICWKIRRALATNPAFRAIHRIKHYYREPGTVTPHANSPSLPLSTHFPQNMKAKKTQGEGTIPIKFDNSIPTSSPQVGISQAVAKVQPEPRYGVSKGEGKDTTGHLKEQQQGKKTLDINDTFSEYIERAKYRIRSASNVGRGQSKSAPVEHSGNSNRLESHKEHLSDFIQHAKKMRTTSSVGKTSSLKRGYTKS
ncbi:hypothetical protein LR48_Vigan03g228200 [Vigna angularis]|uniref:Uncharacterized protein n=2 Tax=Phaseolus angularis TaxID=3914 RepID=A0A0L9U7U7_PHAAN|nr:uncharacterized protein LOC108328686 [Vigna angularis]KAG2405766.1 uncharacterized protein HKW66_Vig0050210 [Vigna angularis]KOM38900.1 hypothetical protein LR48_Vigan03g228200 [Vigna angularis]BAT85402.1 hypothetical protein VIGAN_04294300 [Vigna angularis var. angularis]